MIELVFTSQHNTFQNKKRQRQIIEQLLKFSFVGSLRFKQSDFYDCSYNMSAFIFTSFELNQQLRTSVHCTEI